MQGTIEDAFRQFVTSKLPADLLADLTVTLEDGGFQIKVELRREPTEDEIERLNDVIRSAHAGFRRRIDVAPATREAFPVHAGGVAASAATPLTSGH